MTLAIGEIFSTGPRVTGTFPLETEGRVRSCKVTQGEVVVCPTLFTGDAVLPRAVDGKYVLCSVIAGNVFTCNATGYSGKIALLRPK